MTAVALSDSLGPVCRLLEAELRDQVAKHNVVLWLDLDSHYVDVVNQLRSLRKQGELKYDVCTFGGSFLELMLELEEVMGGVDATRAVIHLPGFNEELVKATPLPELYKAGARNRKALETLVRDAAAGKVRPDQIDEFLQRGNLSLAGADVWLHDLQTTGSEGLASQLRNVSLNELVDDLLLNRSLAQRIAVIDLRAGTTSDGAPRAIRDGIVALTGMPESWFDESLQNSFSSGTDVHRGLLGIRRFRNHRFRPVERRRIRLRLTRRRIGHRHPHRDAQHRRLLSDIVIMTVGRNERSEIRQTDRRTTAGAALRSFRPATR